MSIETHYNVACFVIYLQNIVIWVCSNENYSLKKFHTFGIINQSYYKANSMVILPMNQHEVEHPIVIGGGDLKLFSFQDLKPFLSAKQTDELEAQTFKYVDHLKLCDATNRYNSDYMLFCHIPIHVLVFKLSIFHLQAIAKQHGIKTLAHVNKSSILTWGSGPLFCMARVLIPFRFVIPFSLLTVKLENLETIKMSKTKYKMLAIEST
jgi:hypothetical protein